MRGISPIIATILLIVMTVAIAGLMYAWLTGLFGSLTAASQQQVQQATQVVSYSLSYLNMYKVNISNTTNITNVSLIIFNSGNTPIQVDINVFTVVGTLYYYGNNSQIAAYPANKTSLGGGCSGSAVPPGQQCILNITFNDNGAIYDYVVQNRTAYLVVRTAYRGVVQQVTVT